MNKKIRTQRKKVPRRPLEANERVPSLATINTLAEREAAVLAGEEAADLRHEAADRRHEAADQREEAERVKAELSLHHKEQLREANENLIVATVHAQEMTEAAEKVTTQMAYMAKHDFLTGLPNRALLTDRLAQSIVLAQRHGGGKKVALLFLDLDHFKHVNDSCRPRRPGGKCRTGLPGNRQYYYTAPTPFSSPSHHQWRQSNDWVPDANINVGY